MNIHYQDVVVIYLQDLNKFFCENFNQHCCSKNFRINKKLSFILKVYKIFCCFKIAMLFFKKRTTSKSKKILFLILI